MIITVLYNTPSDRFLTDAHNKEAEEDTIDTANEVALALQEKGAEVHMCPINEHTIEQTIASLGNTLVFNLIEWTGVDTVYAQKTFAALDKKKIVYTGAPWEDYYLSGDKIKLKTKLDRLGLATAKWQAFTTGNEPIRTDISYPVIVKVSLEHSSVGLTKDAVFQSEQNLQSFIKKQIHDFKQPVFIEEFLKGREFQVTIIAINGVPTVLPPAEIIYTKRTDVPLLTYESRWNIESQDYNNSKVIIPKSDAITKKIEAMSQNAFEALGFRDYARFDIRCDTHGTPYFLELNVNPGLGDDDEYGLTLSFKAVGMTFADFVWNIVESAQKRATG